MKGTMNSFIFARKEADLRHKQIQDEQKCVTEDIKGTEVTTDEGLLKKVLLKKDRQKTIKKQGSRAGDKGMIRHEEQQPALPYHPVVSYSLCLRSQCLRCLVVKFTIKKVTLSSC